jgi:hypothetical protein
MIDCNPSLSSPTQTDSHSCLINLLSSFLTFSILTNLFACCVLVLLYGPFGMIFAFLSHLRYIKKLGERRNYSHYRMAMPFQRRIIVYKALPILVGLFNECYRWVFFAWLLFFGSFVISFNLFTFVKFHSQMSLPGAFFLSILAVEGFVCIFIVNALSGKVHHHSSLLLSSWTRAESFSHVRNKKTMKACSSIKIKVGSVNFVDRLTPLVICGFCVRLAVRFSLAAGK